MEKLGVFEGPRPELSTVCQILLVLPDDPSSDARSQEQAGLGLLHCSLPPRGGTLLSTLVVNGFESYLISHP